MNEEAFNVNIAQHVERARRSFPDKIALIFEGKTFTYKELNQLANRIANGLCGLGVKRGDRVALFLPNIPEFVISYLGIQKVGAIAVSINVMLKQDEVKFILSDCGAVTLITNEDVLDNVPLDVPHLIHILIAEGEAGDRMSLAELMSTASAEALALEMTWHDPAAIVYSSGTTGFPKGATLSHGNVISNIQAKKKYCGMRSDDKAILFLPLFHCFGQNAVLNSMLNVGGTIVLHRKFESEPVLHSITNENVTMFFGVPTIFILLLHKASPHDFKSVRYFFSAAAKMPVEIARQWHERYGIVINEGYGLTETSPFACYNHLHRFKSGSIGTPIDDVEVKIVSLEHGRDVAPGELGEIVIRGPNVMLGYWNRPDETAQAIRDGWLHTGDIGKMDDEGYFYIVDRLRDMVNVAGMKVYPAEVENVIYRHPAVAGVAVYAAPDAVTGERVEAKIVLKGNHKVTEGEILALCRQHIASFKIPAAIEFVESLPKSKTGKILKRILREQAQISPLKERG